MLFRSPSTFRRRECHECSNADTYDAVNAKNTCTKRQSFFIATFLQQEWLRLPAINDSVGKCCSDNSSRKSDGGTVKGNTSPDGRRPRRRDVKRREADAGCNRGKLKLFPKLASRPARRAFPKGTLAMVLRDELESISTDEMCVDLFPKRGRPAPGAVAFGGGHRPAGRLSI